MPEALGHQPINTEINILIFFCWEVYKSVSQPLVNSNLYNTCLPGNDLIHAQTVCNLHKSLNYATLLVSQSQTILLGFGLSIRYVKYYISVAIALTPWYLYTSKIILQLTITRHTLCLYTMVTTSNSLYAMHFILSPLNYFLFVPYFTTDTVKYNTLIMQICLCCDIAGAFEKCILNIMKQIGCFIIR